ncbi:ABC transporter permease [Nocardia panacis]|uniref:ABC transporter permease n=1 Tax=Nocardia panacis TaxID=2340916 RepID=A0A3A4KGI3_9NOCA|nr:ABC transporter permease [Nocardia panacis]RJO80019.1 ABC transporter permease [Nocardia panacis]
MTDLIPADLLPAAHSEIRRVVGLRWPRVLAVALIAGAGVVNIGFAVTAGHADPKGQPATGTATIGLYLALAATALAAAIFGALGSGGEYRYGTLATAAQFIPNRDRLVTAKFAVTVGAALAVAALVEVIGGGLLLGLGRGKFPVWGNLIGAFGGGLLAVVCWAVIGTALGMLVRTASGAVTMLLGWLVVVEPLVWLVAGKAGAGGVVALLPGSATIGTVAVGSFAKSPLIAPTPAAIVVLVCWAAAMATGAWWTVRRGEM